MESIVAQVDPELGVAHVALLLTFLLLISAAIFWTAGAIVKRLSDPMGRFRLLVIGGFSLIGLVSYGLLGAIETGIILIDALSPALTNSFVGSFAAKLLTCLLASSVVLVADLSVLPAIRDVRELEQTAREEALKFSRVLILLSVFVAAALTLIDPALSGEISPLFVLPIVVLFVSSLYLVAPVLGVKLGIGREPTHNEADRIASFCRVASLDTQAVRVIDGTSTEIVKTAVYRSFRGRYLHVTDYLLDSLDDDAAGALVAAATGQSNVHYREYLILSLLGVVAGLTVAIAIGSWLAIIVAFGSLAVLIPVFLWGGRRLQFRADAYAAERVGAETVADTFEQVAEIHGFEPKSGRFSRFFKLRPPVGRRIDRLRKRTPS